MMHPIRTNEDLVTGIAKSVFVTNFPEQIVPRDLWKICESYGKVVDVFIPNRKSKEGKRFVFVRFIRVANLERLIGNVNTIWVGRFHLRVNAEKNGVAPSAKEKNEAVKDGVAPSVKVAFGNNTGTQEANSVQAGHDNLHGQAMLELRADVKLKDIIVVAMPKIVGEGCYTCSYVAKKSKIPIQAPRGVPVGPKVEFKLVKKLYRPVSKKHNVNTSGNKKKDVESTKEVSNSNLFDVLNSVKNDVDLGTNWETSNLASKEASSSGSSFWNARSSSICTTVVVDKIDKIEKLIFDGK
nr:hypothetical protein CTI12_AA498410 [Tanacetum cinerariifolium]